MGFVIYVYSIKTLSFPIYCENRNFENALAKKTDKNGERPEGYGSTKAINYLNENSRRIYQFDRNLFDEIASGDKYLMRIKFHGSEIIATGRDEDYTTISAQFY